MYAYTEISNVVLLHTFDVMLESCAQGGHVDKGSEVQVPSEQHLAPLYLYVCRHIFPLLYPLAYSQRYHRTSHKQFHVTLKMLLIVGRDAFSY